MILLVENSNKFSSVQSLSRVCLCDLLDSSTLDFPDHHQLPVFIQTHVHLVSYAMQPSHPLSSPFSFHLKSFPAPGCFPMSQFFTSGPKYWNFSFSISPSNEYPGLISFRMDWLDHLAAQGTLKYLLQHHSSKA